MKKPHSSAFPLRSTGRRRTPGITLVEILVVIVIIAVLAALSTMGVRRMKLAGAKTQTINQLRQISVGVNMWAAEKNAGEPMFASNGTGDHNDEHLSAGDGTLAPGNPAKILFNPLSPDDSYLTDHTLFYSPLAKLKAPLRQDYKPDEATPATPWGSYCWFYPTCTNSQLTPRQANILATYWNVPNVSDAAKGKLLMANEFRNTQPIWRKIYVALMIDGSVSVIGESDAAWTKWAGFEPSP